MEQLKEGDTVFSNAIMYILDAPLIGEAVKEYRSNKTFVESHNSGLLITSCGGLISTDNVSWKPYCRNLLVEKV